MPSNLISIYISEKKSLVIFLSLARFSSFVAFFGIDAAVGDGVCTGMNAGAGAAGSTAGSSNVVPPLILIIVNKVCKC